DIYRTNYKLTNQLAALTELDLPNRVYQYEFAQITLQTEKFQSNGATTFYGYVTENQPVASGAKHENIMKLQAPQAETDYRTVNKITRKKNIEKPITGEPVSEDWLQAKFPDRIQEEKQDDIILSFFTPNYAHVVTLEKEGQLERPHGSILLDKVNLLNPETTLSATTYMYGAFLSQLVA
ncbi:cellobiose phosphorylase, partial [Listeria welshimeri]|nr:cellobiose phosphorylase [Listeria welshimeri]